MALRIGFLTTLGHNVGDEFIREGIRSALDATGEPYTPLYVDKHNIASLHEPAEDEVWLLEDKYWGSDVFIQSGAPVYWRIRDDATSLTAEWHHWMWEERILRDEPARSVMAEASDGERGGRQHPLFVNLGAGSCQPWGQGGAPFLADAACVEFARRAGGRAELTTVRDPVAAEILTALKIQHLALACPAFLAAARHRLDVPRPAGHIAVNLMPLGGHFDLVGGFERAKWEQDCLRLAALLRRLRPLVFVAHDAEERTWMERFAAPGERVFLASTWRPYLDLYAGSELVVANRVHGAVCAAGFGVPGIILGNDTRARIGCALNLTIFQSGKSEIDEVASAAERLLIDRNDIAGELRALRDSTLRTYADLLGPILQRARKRQPAAACGTY